jgi:hypothetical protein
MTEPDYKALLIASREELLKYMAERNDLHYCLIELVRAATKFWQQSDHDCEGNEICEDLAAVLNKSQLVLGGKRL